MDHAPDVAPAEAARLLIVNTLAFAACTPASYYDVAIDPLDDGTIRLGLCGKRFRIFVLEECARQPARLADGQPATAQSLRIPAAAAVDDTTCRPDAGPRCNRRRSR